MTFEEKIIITLIGLILTALAGFIVYLIKRKIENKKHIEELDKVDKIVTLYNKLNEQGLNLSDLKNLEDEYDFYREFKTSTFKLFDKNLFKPYGDQKELLEIVKKLYLIIAIHAGHEALESERVLLLFEMIKLQNNLNKGLKDLISVLDNHTVLNKFRRIYAQIEHDIPIEDITKQMQKRIRLAQATFHFAYNFILSKNLTSDWMPYLKDYSERIPVPDDFADEI